MKVQMLKFKFQIFAACLLLLIAFPSEAAMLFFEPSAKNTFPQSRFLVDFLLNTEDDEINAIEGKVFFPANFLNLVEVRDGNSIVTFWTERPRVSDNWVSFSGVMPGSYAGRNGLIFSLVFEAKTAGSGIVEARNSKAFLNDGLGTPAQLKISDFKFIFSGGKGESSTGEFPAGSVTDYDLPETFEPQIARDPEFFDGKWFLVFATQDKKSGISHYEVREDRTGKQWEKSGSPYVLRDQKLGSYIYVKAVDKAGNERISILPPPRPLARYLIYLVIIGIIIAIVVAYIILKQKMVVPKCFKSLFKRGIWYNK